MFSGRGAAAGRSWCLRRHAATSDGGTCPSPRGSRARCCRRVRRSTPGAYGVVKPSGRRRWPRLELHPLLDAVMPPSPAGCNWGRAGANPVGRARSGIVAGWWLVWLQRWALRRTTSAGPASDRGPVTRAIKRSLSLSGLNYFVLCACGRVKKYIGHCVQFSAILAMTIDVSSVPRAI